MSFNEGFRIPVPANALTACALQLSICSLGPQAQEELLVRLKFCAAYSLMIENKVTATQALINLIKLQIHFICTQS